jgi:ribosomal protein L9
MQVILLEKVANLGNLGDVVRVKDGFARNFLIPQRKARRATETAIADFEARRAELEKVAQEKLSACQAVGEKLKGQIIEIHQKAGVDGRLFGSVTNHDISDSLVHFPDPLFPFEDIVPDAEPLPDPTSSRPHPAFDGLDLVDKSFVDPDLGVCTVISGAPCLSPSRRQPTSCRCTGGAHSSTQLSRRCHVLRPTPVLTLSAPTDCASSRSFRAPHFLHRIIAFDANHRMLKQNPCRNARS